MSRLTWFAGGVAAGMVGASYAKRKVRQTAAHIAPSTALRSAAGHVRSTSRVVADAVREGRQAMRYREDELRARRDGRLTSLDQHVQPGDRVYVDGVPVESGRVIVMRRR
jgi:hypothetical protein